MMFLMPKSENVKDLLKEKDKEHAMQIKELNRTIQELETKDKLLLNTITLLRSNNYKAQRETKIYRDRYEHLKNSPIRRFNDEQIDSVLSALYPR